MFERYCSMKKINLAIEISRVLLFMAVVINGSNQKHCSKERKL